MPSPIELIVFSDDWGRHPSSCQHLVKRLLPRYPTLWVNTIGTRSPRLSMEDVGKIARKLKQWTSPPEVGEALPENLTVISPRMWPGFRAGWQRRFNAKRITRAVTATLEGADAKPQAAGARRVAITTLPITADLVGALPVDHWVYYCVDDFSVWPGLDAQVMREMERELVNKVDAVIAVSDTLVAHIGKLGRQATLLTHGIDTGHWDTARSGVSLEPSPLGRGQDEGSAPVGSSAAPAHHKQGALTPTLSQEERGPDASVNRTLPAWLASSPRPIILFWGVIDRRLDVSWCRAAAEALPGTLILAGPEQSPDPALRSLQGTLPGADAGAGAIPGALPGALPGARVKLPGPVPYNDLPSWAAAADVLVMPYDDLPVTRAMQPLKFKEYLATGKPVVVRKLPSTADWSDCADVVDTAEAFVAAIRERTGAGPSGGTPAHQREARKRRLADESWDEKARAFEAIVMK